MAAKVSTSAYRYSGETLVFIFTLSVLALVVGFSAIITLCSSLLFVLAAFLFSYSATRAHHHSLMQRAYPVAPASSPNLWRQIEICQQRLQPGDLRVYVVQNDAMNAYTFGLESPRVVVLYSPLLQVMDPDELRFVIGHEMGHVRLGHTWLNSLIGGLAGVPSSLFISTFLALIFRGWNRACEYSADRAGLLACGSLEKAISAMVKLVYPDRHLSQDEWSLVMSRLDAEDDNPLNVLGEIFSTHPLLIRRIQRLQEFARTPHYQRLQQMVDSNLA